MTIKEIDKEIARLNKLRWELEKAEIDAFKEKALENIGRCFKVENTIYAKVVGIPAEEHTITDIHINKYQYPALYLGSKDGVMPFYMDTIFSAAWGVGNNVLGTKFEEISKEEFNVELEKRIELFRSRVTRL